MSITSASATRYGLAIAIVAASALFIETPPQALATDIQSVTVNATIEGECENLTSELTFQPQLTTPLNTLIVGGFSETAVISLGIIDGKDRFCDSTYGYVTFTETGFEDAFLTWGYDCDGFPMNSEAGTYTCQGVQGTNSPLDVDLEVTAGVGATPGLGVDSNIITFTLVAEADG